MKIHELILFVTRITENTVAVCLKLYYREKIFIKNKQKIFDFFEKKRKKIMN